MTMASARARLSFPGLQLGIVSKSPGLSVDVGQAIGLFGHALPGVWPNPMGSQGAPP